MLLLANLSSTLHLTRNQHSITPPSLKKDNSVQVRSLLDIICNSFQQKPVIKVTTISVPRGEGDDDSRTNEEGSSAPPPPPECSRYPTNLNGRVFPDITGFVLPPIPPPIFDHSLLDQLNAAQKEYEKGIQETDGLAKKITDYFSQFHRCKKNISYVSSFVEMNHLTFTAYVLFPSIIKAVAYLNIIRLNFQFKEKIDYVIERTLRNQTASQPGVAPNTALQHEGIAAQARHIHLQRKQTNDKKLFSGKTIQFFIKELPNVALAFIVKRMPLVKGAKKPLIEILKNLNQIFVARSHLFKQNELIYSLNPVQDISAADAVSGFLTKLKQCKNFQEVKDALNSAGISEEILPEQFEQFRLLIDRNPRYQNDISNRYLYSHQKQAPFIRLSQPHPSNAPIARPYANGQYIEQLLQKRQREAETKIASIKQEIKNKIDAIPLDQDFEPIRRSLKILGIDLDDLRVNGQPVANREALLQLRNDDQLMEHLAKTRLSEIETKASSAIHAIRTVLMSKHPEERSLLKFTMFTSTFSALFGGLQLSFVFSEKIKAFFSENCTMIIKSFSKNLINLPNIGLLFVLFPSTSIKVLSIFLTIGKHIFCKQFKPNEYSAEGYKLRLKIVVLTTFYYLYSAILNLNTAIMWLNISLIEHRIMQMEIKENDERYQEIDTARENAERDYIQNLKPLEDAHNVLQEQDVDFMLNSNKNGTATDGSRLKTLETIISTLNKEDFQYYQQEFQDFLNLHLDLGIKPDGSTALTQQKIANQVRKLFTAEGNDFITLHRDNQTLYSFISHH